MCLPLCWIMLAIVGDVDQVCRQERLQIGLRNVLRTRVLAQMLQVSLRSPALPVS